MTRRLQVLVASVGIFLCCGVAQAARVPIIVSPDPIQFGTVPLNSPSNFLTIYVSNTSADAVVVTAMSFSGANSSDFAFSGPTCVGAISGGQYCEMNLTFTPSAIGSLSTGLVVAFS